MILLTKLTKTIITKQPLILLITATNCQLITKKINNTINEHITANKCIIIIHQASTNNKIIIKKYIKKHHIAHTGMVEEIVFSYR